MHANQKLFLAIIEIAVYLSHWDGAKKGSQSPTRPCLKPLEGREKKGGGLSKQKRTNELCDGSASTASLLVCRKARPLLIAE